MISRIEENELAKKTAWVLTNSLRGLVYDPIRVFSFAYCLLIGKLFAPELIDPRYVIHLCSGDGEIARFLEETLFRHQMESEGMRNAYASTLHNVTVNGLAAFLTIGEVDGPRDFYEYSTPYDVNRLALRLLDPEEGSRIADFGCGMGSFMIQAAETVPHAHVFGIELYKQAACIARIRMSAYDVNYLAEYAGGDLDEIRNAIKMSLRHDVRCGDMLELMEPGMCDYAFSNYPWGMRTAGLRARSAFADRARSGALGYRRPASADWVFNHMLVDAIAGRGKAVAIMTGGACYNTTDESARRHFVEAGYIESIIALPTRIFPGTDVSFIAVVLSRGNKSVRMIDASDLATPGRRTNALTDAAIDEIARRIAHDVDGRSKMVDAKELASTGYVLSPVRYLQRPISIRNGRKLDEVVAEISRGATIRASELDNLSVNETTAYRYLMLRDIQDGVISEDLPYLSRIDKRLERHCIKDGDVLLSKNGAPFKVAVAEVPDDTTLLANGNLYMIRVNQEVMDPYYLAAFLSSNKGMEVLSNAVVGVTIPSIPLRTLREIPVPVPPLEDQQRVVAEYQAKLDEVRILKMRVQRAIDDARSLFDGEE